MRWRSVSPEALAWRDFDGEIVVRNAATGSTHHLEAFASGVLRALVDAGEPLSVADLEARLRARSAAENDNGEWAASIQGVLNEFQRLGLAEPRPD